VHRYDLGLDQHQHQHVDTISMEARRRLPQQDLGCSSCAVKKARGISQWGKRGLSLSVVFPGVGRLLLHTLRSSSPPKPVSDPVKELKPGFLLLNTKGKLGSRVCVCALTTAPLHASLSPLLQAQPVTRRAPDKLPACNLEQMNFINQITTSPVP